MKTHIKLLANENIPIMSVRLLYESGIDINSIAQRCPGISDQEVIKLAVAEGRIIVTFDRDYGELVFKYRMKVLGIIYLKFIPKTPDEVAGYINQLLKNPNVELTHKFTVCDRHEIRQRPLLKIIEETVGEYIVSG